MSMPIAMHPFSAARNGHPIAGELCLPCGTPPLAAAILAHGFGDSMEGTRPLAQYLAGAGLAVYIFDFIGGSLHSRSGGAMTDMSVLTEADDFAAVLAAVRTHPLLKGCPFFLMGESQGGFVATYTAVRHPEAAGLIALYPAYVLQDDARRRVAVPGYTPGVHHIMGCPVGACYERDALSFDIYDLMADCRMPVLLLHGTSDPIAPLAYSQRAADVLPQAVLHPLPGTGHGFTPGELPGVTDLCMTWIRAHLPGSHTA